VGKVGFHGVDTCSDPLQIGDFVRAAARYWGFMIKIGSDSKNI
jgi:hypothetical protein